MPGASSGLTRERGRATRLLSYSALLRVGFAEPARSPAPLVSSYLTVSPLPFAERRFAFCGTGPCGYPPWPLASTLPCGARTFLLPRCRDRRPSGLLWRPPHYIACGHVAGGRGAASAQSSQPRRCRKMRGGVTGQRHDYRLRLTPALEGSRSRRRYRGSGRHAPRRPRRRAAQRRAC